MAEFKFPCPSCKQNIICDELWCGQAIQCPSCNTELVVPAQQAASASPLVPPPPPPGAPKLSIGRHQQPASASTPATGQRFIPGTRPLPPPKKKKSGNVLKFVKIAVVVIMLGAGGYFGWNRWTARQEKANAQAAASKAAANPSEASPPVEKKLPVIPPTYTLDIAAAKIPEGQANGSIAGTNFVVDTGRIERIGTAQVLQLRPASGQAPDREIWIYLHPAAGEALAGRNWTISQEMKGAAVPQVLKRWKPNPNAAQQQKFFSSGYAMKLELGEATEGVIPGKIFLALPDAEQSIVAGMFKINPGSTDPAAQPVIAQPEVPGAQTPAQRDAFQKRYGVKR